MPRTPRRNQWNRAARKCEGRCWYCGVLPDAITVDHATPRSRGGKNKDDNLLPACSRCNTEKDNLSVSEYRKFVKVIVIRKLIELGYGSCDLGRRVRIVFWGEGNRSPFSY